MNFRNKEELNKDYKVKASFYYYDFHNIGKIKCRNVADIIRIGYEDGKIDAYIIMMNPGSCKSEFDNIPSVSKLEDIPIELYVASDDPAQRCVMQLMDNTNLNKIRIVNLSDNAEGNSEKATGIMNSIKNEGYTQHCIFSEERRKELERLTEEDAFYILSWSKNNSLIIMQNLQSLFLKEKDV